MTLNSVLYGNNSLELMRYGAEIFVLTSPNLQAIKIFVLYSKLSN